MSKPPPLHIQRTIRKNKKVSEVEALRRQVANLTYSLSVLTEAAERVCMLHEWDMIYRDAPSLVKGSADEIQMALVQAVTAARK